MSARMAAPPRGSCSIATRPTANAEERIGSSPAATPEATAPLIRTAPLIGVEPEAYLRQVIARISAHPVNRRHDLLPLNIAVP